MIQKWTATNPTETDPALGLSVFEASSRSTRVPVILYASQTATGRTMIGVGTANRGADDYEDAVSYLNLGSAERRKLIELLQAHERAANPVPETPDVIVMQVETAPDEEEIEVEFPPVYAGMPPRVGYYKDGEHVVICPHTGCDSDAFYEVDRAERWNPAETYTDDGMPVLEVRQGSDGDGYQTDHHKCQGCYREVALPDWLETHWS